MIDTKEKHTVKEIVNKVWESQIKVNDEFSGLEFKKLCVALCPQMSEKYVETFLRLLRYEHREEFVCINRAKSKFRRVI